jgi:hypothetical protein
MRSTSCRTSRSLPCFERRSEETLKAKLVTMLEQYVLGQG